MTLVWRPPNAVTCDRQRSAFQHGASLPALILKQPLTPTMEACLMAANLTFWPTVFRLIYGLQHEQFDMTAP